MPPLKKNSFKKGFKTWADKKSIELRKDLGLNSNDALCAFDLIAHLNIPLFVPQDFKELDTKHLDELLGNGKEHWSAVTIPLKNDKYLIIHNPEHSAQRQQSNLMHELAHVICDHKVDPKIEETGLAGMLRHHDQEQENEAIWFGGCLQLPREALIWALKKSMTNNEIAEHFNASVEMVRYRIGVTGAKIQLVRMRY
ncbi:ImmA/IrrE family metallo-endopeptidase [Fluviicola taffensis]|uniref:IrrE N-terminal-like domain-containing protein n=1 Tax=Fluviicola taffensis (strain DSM 16823 / NCIMB 13979 / RW262) TaxID=755732 RepID=F2IJ95_FLUTR|nr:ImmA/IrrE family metallo-endopeptidase [Fluviicola taffensis]AEA44965.1 protein of unknown function DUF955 [Fluviicola taffensis DSM 16823]